MRVRAVHQAIACLGIFVPLVFLGAHAAQAATTDTLGAGQSLGAGQAIWSADGNFEAVMQGDGNFVVYGPNGPSWSSQTMFGNGGVLAMQTDGNLVVYTPSRSAAWSSVTAPGHNDRLVMQSDGNLVIYDGGNRPAWSSQGGPTGLHGDRLFGGQSLGAGQAIWSADGNFEAVMQGDGNFVVYGPNGPSWSSQTMFGNGGVLAMQTDGNLVVYTPSRGAAWSSSTVPGHNDWLVMQSDGNLVIYDGGNRPAWSSQGGPTGLHGDRLVGGQSLGAGQAIWSADGNFEAVMQGDGNFVVYGPNGPSWSSQTMFGNGGVLAMQTDGNLVVYGPNGPKWNSQTMFGSDGVLVMQTDGNLVLYKPGAVPAWSSQGGTVGPTAAPVASGNYPDNGALCSHTDIRNGSCANFDWGYKQSNGDWTLLSNRGFGFRNCTDFAAWSKGLTWASFHFPKGKGNAADWKDYAAKAGLRVSSTPVVGAIAWWGSEVGHGYGHVSIVTAKNGDGTAETVDYNGDNLGNYGAEHSRKADAYLH